MAMGWVFFMLEPNPWAYSQNLNLPHFINGFFFFNPKPAPLGPTQPCHNLGPKPWPNKKKGLKPDCGPIKKIMFA